MKETKCTETPIAPIEDYKALVLDMVERTNDARLMAQVYTIMHLRMHDNGEA